MSPLEIPGTSIQIPYPYGTKTCNSCDRDYNKPYVDKSGDTVTLQCPFCGHVLRTFSLKALRADQDD